MIGDALRKARAAISCRNNGSEFAILKRDSSLLELLDEIQELKLEMNLAKKEAMAKAAEPYLETLRELEDLYVVYLQLASG